MFRNGIRVLAVLIASACASSTPPNEASNDDPEPTIATVVVTAAGSSPAPTTTATLKARRPDPPSKPGSYRPGDRIEVEWEGKYYRATVTDVVGQDRYRIHYEGYGPEWDEVVGPSRMRDVGEPGPPPGQSP